MSANFHKPFFILNQHLEMMTEALPEVQICEDHIEALRAAAQFFKNEIAPAVRCSESPEPLEIVRFLKYFHERDIEGKAVLREIQDTVLTLSDYIEGLRGLHQFACLNRTIHNAWKRHRARLAGAALNNLNGNLLYFVADVMELFGRNTLAKSIRLLASMTDVKKGIYAFHDGAYIDVVEISDDE